jgi:hypothetical protein
MTVHLSLNSNIVYLQFGIGKVTVIDGESLMLLREYNFVNSAVVLLCQITVYCVSHLPAGFHKSVKCS